MARRGGGFGFVMLLVVAVVVLLLAARAWERVGSTAGIPVEAARPDGERRAAGAALENLPGLDEMRRATDDHVARIDEIEAGAAEEP